jgi:transcriptional regulator with XRE-family HTH domain
MTSGKTISENIKRLRNKHGLTQDDLAKKADIKYTTLMKVESGTVNKPSVQTMAKNRQSVGCFNRSFNQLKLWKILKSHQ